MVNDTTRLLGLAVTKVVAAGNGMEDGPVVHLATTDERARCCPECGVAAVRVKGWVTTRPRDLPVAGRRCAVRWRKRRWCCDQASCPRQTFTEQVPQIPARSRLALRLRQAAGAAVGDGGRTVIQSARVTACRGRWRSPSMPGGCCPPSPHRSRCWASTRSAGDVLAGCWRRPPAPG
ncbi:transposase family protein [Nonomuraea wenchangensis]